MKQNIVTGQVILHPLMQCIDVGFLVKTSGYFRLVGYHEHRISASLTIFTASRAFNPFQLTDLENMAAVLVEHSISIEKKCRSFQFIALRNEANDFSKIACLDDCYPAFAFIPAASMPAIAQASSLSDVSPLTPTAPSRAVPSMIRTPPGTGTRRPCAIVFTALTK